MQAWQARQFQVVWFLRNASSASSTDLYKVASGGSMPSATFTNQAFDPENPMPFAAPTVIQHAQGILDQRLLTVNIQPQRADIFFQPSQPSGQTFNAPVFMDLDDQKRFVYEVSSRISGFLSDVYRMGFVSNYVLQFPTLEDANNHLLNALGLDLDYLSQGTELSFGVNRKLPLNGHVLNRLCKWQVELYANVSFVFDSLGRLVPQNLPPIFAAAMMVDVNNEPNLTAETRPQDVVGLLDDLFAESFRIANIGSPEALRQ